MKRELYENLKEDFKNISQMLEDKTLEPEEKKKLEEIKTQLAAALLSPWLPLGYGRRFVMLILGICSLYFLFNSSYFESAITLIFLGFFSPRVIGEIAVFIGTIKNKN